MPPPFCFRGAETRPREPGTPAAEVDLDVTYRTSEEDLLPPSERYPGRGPRLDLMPAYPDSGEDGDGLQSADGNHRRHDWDVDEPGKASPVAAGGSATAVSLRLVLVLLVLLPLAAAGRRRW